MTKTHNLNNWYEYSIRENKFISCKDRIRMSVTVSFLYNMCFDLSMTTLHIWNIHRWLDWNSRNRCKYFCSFQIWLWKLTYITNKRKKLTLSCFVHHNAVQTRQGPVYIQKMTNEQREIESSIASWSLNASFLIASLC